MEKHTYIGKNREEAINNAKADLQEVEENLIINEKEIKQGLFKTKKTEIEVIEKREVVKFIKEYTYNLLKDIGFNANIEVRKNKDIPTYTIYSDNDSLLIGKNGKNLKAISFYIGLHINKMIGRNFKYIKKKLNIFSFLIIYIFIYYITAFSFIFVF